MILTFIELSHPPPFCGVTLQAAETPRPPLVFRDGAVKMPGGKVRPEHIHKHQLGIGRLPRQEVGGALFAGSTDHQVAIGNVRIVQKN